MKKLVCISGIATVLLLTLILTGWADADDAVKKSLRLGNLQYESAKYKDALISYETGLEKKPEHQTLCFNAAQAAYLTGEYQKAVEYYGKSGDSVEKFLNAGNIFFKAGDAVEIPEESEVAEESEESDNSDNSEKLNEKMQYYAQALQLYQEGITKFPQNVPLKYNYEAVKEKLEEMAQENGGQSQSESDENGEESENSESEEGEEQESQESSQGEQGENEEQQEQQGEQGEEGEDEENEEQQEQSAGDEEEGDEEQDSYSQDDNEDGEDGENEPDQEAIERILTMLESQEEESLKNNQEVSEGKGGQNGW